MDMTKRKDAFIQITRILSCIGVCAVHLKYKFEIHGISGNLMELGRYCLFVFFVLSGYLVGMWNGENRKRFIIKKIIRLVPVYYVTLFCCIFIHNIVLRENHGSILNWLRYFTGLNAWLPSIDPFWKSLHVNWYVSVVWGFYVIAALFWGGYENYPHGFGMLHFWVAVCLH